MAYDRQDAGNTATAAGAASASADATSSTAASGSSDQAVMKRILELMHAYVSHAATANPLAGTVKVSA